MSEWVLKDTQGRHLMRWIDGFGPALTTDIDKAVRFPSKESALRHPAHSFALTFLNPVEIPGGPCADCGISRTDHEDGSPGVGEPDHWWRARKEPSR